MLGNMKNKGKKKSSFIPFPPMSGEVELVTPPPLQKVIGLKHVKTIISPFICPKLMPLALTLRKIEMTFDSRHLTKNIPSYHILVLRGSSSLLNGCWEKNWHG